MKSVFLPILPADPADQRLMNEYAKLSSEDQDAEEQAWWEAKMDILFGGKKQAEQ